MIAESFVWKPAQKGLLFCNSLVRFYLCRIKITAFLVPIRQMTNLPKQISDWCPERKIMISYIFQP